MSWSRSEATLELWPSYENEEKRKGKGERGEGFYPPPPFFIAWNVVGFYIILFKIQKIQAFCEFNFYSSWSYILMY